MIDNFEFERLMNRIKVFENSVIDLPQFGLQKKYKLHQQIDEYQRYLMIVNRKGHQNVNNLTLIMHCLTPKLQLVRLDVNGAAHENKNGEMIETPHLHIFNETYDYGRIAIRLEEVTDINLIIGITDVLDFFLDYNNVLKDGLIINDIY